MTVRNSLPTDLATGLPVLDTRVALATLITRDSAGNPRPGVFPGAPALLVTGTATMSYNIGVFGAATSRTAGGVELIGNDGTINRVTTAAPSSNSRIDIIYLRPRFAASGDGSSAPDVLVAQGTAALSPVAPTLPTGSLELARATIPSGASGTNSGGVVITQTYPYTAAPGGTVTVRNSIELNAWTPADGAAAYNLADGALYFRRAGAWKRSDTASGSVSGNTSSSGSVVVTHGLGVIPTAVLVQPRASSTGDTAGRLFRPIIWGAPSATSFDVRFVREDTNAWVSDVQAVQFYWQAIP